MKNKLIGILDELSNYYLDTYYCTLAINHKKLCEEQKFDLSVLKSLVIDDVENFNLTLYSDEYSEYNNYYCKIQLILYSGGIIFNCMSNYLSNLCNTEIKPIDIPHLFEIVDIHKQTSKMLYNKIKRI